MKETEKEKHPLQELIDSQKPLEPEFQEIINRRFDDLIDGPEPFNPIYNSPEISDEKEKLRKEFNEIFDPIFEKEMTLNNPIQFKRAYPTLWNNVILPAVYSIIGNEREKNKLEFSDYTQSYQLRQSAVINVYIAEIQELQSEIDDNRKVIAANGMTIGELRSWVEKYKTAMKQ